MRDLQQDSKTNARYTSTRAASLFAFVLYATSGLASASTIQSGPPTIQHHAVSTSDSKAQRMFDEGLTLVYAFNRDEATARFRKAAAADPNLAMAWWGIALSQGPNINVPMDSTRVGIANAALVRARHLAKNATPGERAYIDALAKRYSSDPKASRTILDRAYMNAMKAVTASAPGDLDAATLYAESILDVAGGDHLYDAARKPAPLTSHLVTTLESVLRRDPTHIGACHFYIHALDASGHPERASACAARLAALSLEPAASHLTHMGSHIWMQTGAFALLQRDGARSVIADETFARSHGIDPRTLDYYDHNLDFWAGAAIMRGRLTDYDRIAKRYGTREFPLYYLARLARWNVILNAPDLNVRKPSASPESLLAWHYARCLAFAALQHPTGAARERNAYVAIETKLPSDERAFFEVERNVVDAKVADAVGDGPRAVTFFERALAIADAQPADNYPNWRFPLREWLGTSYLHRGNAAAAEGVFRQDLARDKGNGRSLYGLMLALQAQRSPDVAAVERAYHAAWRQSDTPLHLAQL